MIGAGNPYIGFGASGGSLLDQAFAGFFARSESANADNASRQILASRSMILDQSSPMAHAANCRMTAGVIGSGLRYAPMPKKRLLYGNSDLFEAIGEEWDAISLSHAMDATGRMTAGELESKLFRNAMIGGDAFLVRKKQGWRLLESRVCFTPPWMDTDPANSYIRRAPNGAPVVDGVELSKRLSPRAYWFTCDPRRGADLDTWYRVPAYGGDGLPRVLHFSMIDRADQYRGIPLSAPLLEVLWSTLAYSKAETQGAIMEACQTYVVTTNAQNPTLDPLLGLTQTQLDAPLIPDEKGDDAPSDFAIDPLGMRTSWLGGMAQATNIVSPGTSLHLRPGEDVKFLDPRRPNSYYAQFLEAQARLVGACLGIPYEVLMQHFDSSYSASRAALAQFRCTCDEYRCRFVESVVKPMFAVFCADLGFDAESAWLMARESVWTMRERPIHIDEEKELRFWIDAVAAGLCTKDEAAQAMFGHDAVVEVDGAAQNAGVLDSLTNDKLLSLQKMMQLGLVSRDDLANMLLNHDATGTLEDISIAYGQMDKVAPDAEEPSAMEGGADGNA